MLYFELVVSCFFFSKNISVSGTPPPPGARLGGKPDAAPFVFFLVSKIFTAVIESQNFQNA